VPISNSFHNFTIVEMTQLLSINIITELPIWFSVFCIILGGLYAFFLYRKEDKFSDTPNWVVKTMAFSRFLLVSILAFLLLSPFVKTLFNRVEKPVIIIAQDNSSSILLNKDSSFYNRQYLTELDLLKKSLEEMYDVKSYTFGEGLNEGSKIDYSEKITDISNVFEEVENKFYNRNVGAVLLATDGVFNQGSNPVYNSKIEFPVYAIALGDTSFQKDIVLKEVNFNKLTFLGNKFPIEISAQAFQCLNNKTKLTVTHDGKELYSKQYDIETNEFSIDEDLLFEADKVGMQHYLVSLTSLNGEVSIENNTKDIYIEVLDGRQSVLILANSPHPDVKALKLSIENNENYKVTSQLMSDFDGNTAAYSLVIVHQLPRVITPSLKKLFDSDLSILYMLGNQTFAQLFNTLNTGLTIDNSNGSFSEVLPVIAENFPLFTLSKNAIKNLNQMPPVVGPFGAYKMNTNGYVLLNQKIGSVETSAPLLSFFQNDNKKVAVFSAEGVWKWRMQDYLRNDNHNSFDELINKTVQFLSVKEDKGKFRVFTENIYTENQEVRFSAELYNDSYELINDPEVTVSLLSEEGNKYTFVFSRTTNGYVLNAGLLPAGFYTYNAKVKLGNKDYVENGKLQIKQLFLEANNTRANHQLLQNIAEKFGGRVYLPMNLDEVSKTLVENNDIAAIIYEENDLKELINLKWIFFILITLLSLEWFLRKRNGAY